MLSRSSPTNWETDALAVPSNGVCVAGRRVPTLITVRRILVLLALLAVAAAAVVPAASASEIIDRNATGVKLLVNAKGEALVSYRVRGLARNVLVWGAVNAIAPTRSSRQRAFQVDYSGGWGKYYLGDPRVRQLQTKYRQIKLTPGYLVSPTMKELSSKSSFAKNYWRDSFQGSCGRYDGPALAWLVTACKAADGSYWALQSWERALPNYGLTPTKTQAVWELHLSHWTGELPVLKIATDWAWHRWDHLYGTFTYKGKPVYGFASTPDGQPLDTFGRNLYVDTLDSAYGSGWKRENSFLTHVGTGVFCYSVNPHDVHPAGKGKMYRATIIGPGVTPDIMWQGAAPPAYDKAADANANATIAALNDKKCRPN
jgi:hypothetical protein